MRPPDRTRVTVIVPTYNRRDSLRRCLDGILACEMVGFAVELRVTDDGSTDGTGEMVAELTREYVGPARIHYHCGPNGGQSSARNRAIDASDTDLLIFTDDDCLPDPGWLRAMVHAEWSSDTAAMGGRLVASGQGNWVSRYCRYQRYNEYPPTAGPGKFANSANCAYRREPLLEVGRYELRLPRLVDQDLGRRLTEAGYRVGYQPNALVHHYHRESVRILARDYWRRGYTSILRNLLWNEEIPITAKRLRGETAGLWKRGLRSFLALPIDAAKLARAGVPSRDALPFAFLDWVQWTAGRCGKVAVLRKLLSGELPRDQFTRTVYTAEKPVLAPEEAAAVR